MKTKLISILIAGTLITPAFAGDAVQVKPFADEQFLAVPTDIWYPEGLSANTSNGDIFVATFNVPNADYNPTPVNSILRYSSNGELLARSDFSGPTPFGGHSIQPNR